MITSEKLFNKKHTLEELNNLLLNEPDNLEIQECIDYYSWYVKVVDMHTQVANEKNTGNTGYSDLECKLDNIMIGHHLTMALRKINNDDKKSKSIGTINTDPDVPIILTHDLGNINI